MFLKGVDTQCTLWVRWGMGDFEKWWGDLSNGGMILKYGAVTPLLTLPLESHIPFPVTRLRFTSFSCSPSRTNSKIFCELTSYHLFEMLMM